MLKITRTIQTMINTEKTEINLYGTTSTPNYVKEKIAKITMLIALLTAVKNNDLETVKQFKSDLIKTTIKNAFNAVK